MLNEMKTIKFKIIVCAVTLCCIALKSCSYQEDYDIPAPEIVFGHLKILDKKLSSDAIDGSALSLVYQVSNSNEQIKLSTHIESNRYRSALSYKKDESEWMDISVFDIDVQEIIDKINMNIIIEKHARALKKKLDAKIVSRMANIIEGLPELLYNELNQREYINESTLSVFYHLAALNTVRRAYEYKEDCQCETYIDYLSGEAPFICRDDFMIDADWAYDEIKENAELLNFIGYYIDPTTALNYLKSHSGNMVSGSLIDYMIDELVATFWGNLSEDERQHINNEYSSLEGVSGGRSDGEYTGWPIDPTCWFWGTRAGGDCGCCGNYSGPCFACSIICYKHDKDCQTCEPYLYCLAWWACKKTACHKWFW